MDQPEGEIIGPEARAWVIELFMAEAMVQREGMGYSSASCEGDSGM